MLRRSFLVITIVGASYSLISCNPNRTPQRSTTPPAAARDGNSISDPRNTTIIPNNTPTTPNTNSTTLPPNTNSTIPSTGGINNPLASILNNPAALQNLISMLGAGGAPGAGGTTGTGFDLNAFLNNILKGSNNPGATISSLLAALGGGNFANPINPTNNITNTNNPTNINNPTTNTNNNTGGIYLTAENALTITTAAHESVKNYKIIKFQRAGQDVLRIHVPNSPSQQSSSPILISHLFSVLHKNNDSRLATLYTQKMFLIEMVGSDVVALQKALSLLVEGYGVRNYVVMTTLP